MKVLARDSEERRDFSPAAASCGNHHLSEELAGMCGTMARIASGSVFGHGHVPLGLLRQTLPRQRSSRSEGARMAVGPAKAKRQVRKDLGGLIGSRLRRASPQQVSTRLRELVGAAKASGATGIGVLARHEDIGAFLGSVIEYSPFLRGLMLDDPARLAACSRPIRRRACRGSSMRPLALEGGGSGGTHAAPPPRAAGGGAARRRSPISAAYGTWRRSRPH